MSDSTFINLHEQMNTKGWIPDWEFNQAINLYKYNSCTTIDECRAINPDVATDIDENGAWLYHLGSLTDGTQMFYKSAIESFSGDLSSLTDSNQMFHNAALRSFSGDLSSLTNGRSMFSSTALQTFSTDLPSLTNGSYMFDNTPLQSFSGDLSSLKNGYYMFYKSALQSFNINLSSLTSGGAMFAHTPLQSFSNDLSSLTNGNSMFYMTALESFDGDLSKLNNGGHMFIHSALQSFNGDLSSLTIGGYMFKNNQPRHYGVSYYKMVGGTKKLVTETFVSNGLKSFTSKLSSLENGYQMFGSGADVTYTYTDDSGTMVTETTKDVAPLDEKSIMIIADTIKDINGLGLTGENGQLWLGYDTTTITDTTNINKYCDQIAAKGWTVYLNGAAQVANNGVIETIPLTDENGSPIVIPYYYKPVQVTDQKIAEYVDANGNFYIIVGGQHVFGDDISSYGMFTSYEHAVNEISLGLGLTPCEKPDEEIVEEES